MVRKPDGKMGLKRLALNALLRKADLAAVSNDQELVESLVTEIYELCDSADDLPAPVSRFT